MFGISSFILDKGIKFDTSLFIQKLYSRTISFESNFEEDFDMKNHFTIKGLPDPMSIREATSRLYVVKKPNNPSVIKNSVHVDFYEKILDRVRFME